MEKETKAKQVSETILMPSFQVGVTVIFTLKAMGPLVQVLWHVEIKTNVPQDIYIYIGMYRAKEALMKAFGEMKRST